MKRSRRACITKSRERLKREWSPQREAEWKRELEDFYGDNADEELHCIPRASSGAFLSSVLIEARMEAGVPVIRWEMPAEFAERSEDVRRAETAAFLEDHLQPILEALDPALRDLLRRGLRAPRRSHRDLAAARSRATSSAARRSWSSCATSRSASRSRSSSI